MTWQQRMQERHTDLMRVTRDKTETRETRIAALDRAIRLETILAEEGEFAERVTS